MIQYEDQCVGCPPELGCMGDACPNRNVAVYCCDRCGDELDKVYVVEDEELCESCLKEMFLRSD